MLEIMAVMQATTGVVGEIGGSNSFFVDLDEEFKKMMIVNFKCKTLLIDSIKKNFYLNPEFVIFH